MANDSLEEKPLAPAAARRLAIIDEAAPSPKLKAEEHRWRHGTCIKCCGCVSALLLVLAVIILVLAFTVCHVKDPVLKMESVNINGLDGITNLTGGAPAKNLTVVVGVAVRNPNAASFRFSNASTAVYYDGVVVGEGRNPPGVAKARRTLHMNITVYVMVDIILGVSSLSEDLRSGVLPVRSYTEVPGKVKILKIVKKHAVVKMNCTMNVNIETHRIQDQDCKRTVSF
ncbi:uncharacterized protein LOC127813439 [Diospyros lotus]|uniref:uncharacterized protein LOC127813439 n=1 Tax=Diospyros lotus TaxID=55363 RepID=UPI002253725A|nr:uncharacterized protein LOC127813439 [Diospyros lotus]